MYDVCAACVRRVCDVCAACVRRVCFVCAAWVQGVCDVCAAWVRRVRLEMTSMTLVFDQFICIPIRSSFFL